MADTPLQIGRYTILERLAVGGMAQVYLGFETGDTALNRLVVIKQILPKHCQDESFKKMFTQEARLAANINHPNVVEIHELGLDDDQPFISMEYVAGVALNLLMRHTQKRKVDFPVGVAIGIIAQACAGAHAAHELQTTDGKSANLVHRDLTPHNLIISELGHIKVLDFGVAKATSNQEKTQTGMLKGKLPYMSPEQLWQKDLDRRSDVFTLGVVLWELLLGKRLFQREAEVATINAVLNATLPKIEAIRTDVPGPVIDAAMRALAKEPENRFSTADEFRQTLLEVAREERIDCTEDTIRAFVETQLGSDLAARRAEVNAQVEKSINRVPTTTQAGATLAIELNTAEPKTGKRKTLGLGLAGAALLAVGMGIGTYFLQQNGEDPSDPQVEIENVVADNAVTIMLAPTVSPDILRKDLEPLRRYLSRTIKQPVDWLFASSYSEASAELIAGNVHFASLPPALYVQTASSEPKVELVAIKVHSGSTGSDAVLLVRGSDDIQGIQDLKGGKICYSDPQSTTGYFLPRNHLRENGIDPDRDLQRPAIISGGHMQLIEDVISGKCDVGGTFTAIYMTAGTKNIQAAQARVLAVTGRTPHDAIVAAPNVEPELKRQLREALVAFEPTREVGRPELGQVERITGFSVVSDDVFEPVRKALDAERASTLVE